VGFELKFNFLIFIYKDKTMSKEMRKHIDTFKKFNLNENKNEDFKEHDVVILKTNVGGIPKGTKGTIVFDYESGGMFEVEFFDNEHNTIGVERIFKGDLKKRVG
jgi:hypothetical protein